MSDSFLPKSVTPESAPTEAPKKDVFVPDYRYASAAEIHNVTVNHLAKLEAELHTLRMAFVANGRNANLMIAPDRRLGAEMQKIEASIIELSVFFKPILNPE